MSAILTRRIRLLCSRSGPAYSSNVALFATLMAFGLFKATFFLVMVISTTPLAGPFGSVSFCRNVQDGRGC